MFASIQNAMFRMYIDTHIWIYEIDWSRNPLMRWCIYYKYFTYIYYYESTNRRSDTINV